MTTVEAHGERANSSVIVNRSCHCSAHAQWLKLAGKLQCKTRSGRQTKKTFQEVIKNLYRSENEHAELALFKLSSVRNAALECKLFSFPKISRKVNVQQSIFL